MSNFLFTVSFFYSRQNLLSGNTKTNEVSSVPSVYPIADRMVNTVHNTTQTQSTQTWQSQAQTRPTQAKTRSTQAQTSQATQAHVRYSSSQKRNLNMHEPEGLDPNTEANKYNPNTRQDINRIMHRQTRGPYNDIYEMRHVRNRAEKSGEFYRSCARGPLMAVAVSNQPPSDSSEDNQELSLSETIPLAAPRNHAYAIPDLASVDGALEESSSFPRSEAMQLINVMVPDTSSDEERPTRRRRLLSQNIERLRKQFVKQSNRVSDRTGLPNAEDPPPAYETITNSFAAQQGEPQHHDEMLPQHWQRIRDPSGDTMAALSFVAEYLARNEQSIIDPPRIEELVYNVHDRMLHLCSLPQSKWETQHLQNFLATLKQELICFIGKKCLDVTSKILANMKSNLFGCFEFSTPVHGPSPDIAIQQSEACASTSNAHWDTESTPTTSGQDTNHFSTETSSEFHRSSLQPTGQVNNDRDLAEADQSYSDSFWTMQGELSPILFNTRLRSSLLVASKAAHSSPQAASQASTDTEINLALCNNMPVAEVMVVPQQEPLDNGDLDQVHALMSESHQQPVTEPHIFPDNTSQSHDDLGDDKTLEAN